MKMRITGGTAKGRRIGYGMSFSKEEGTGELRPTSSKVREAIFDILRDRITGSLFVDLYAGTGAVGMEALSRGAAKAVFVESSRARADMIDSLLARYGLKGHSIVVNSRAEDFIREGPVSDSPCDIVFLDPPYISDEIESALHLLGEVDLLSAGGILVAEHSSRLALPEGIGALRKTKDYRYGDTTLTTYRMEES
jgi:16S rRNA (guanine966-N2)-methyltransferase